MQSQEGQNGRDQSDLDPQKGQLESGNGAPDEIEKSVNHLGEGGINCRDFLIVDGGPDRVAVIGQSRRLRAVLVGIDPLRLQIAFPQVTVEIVGQHRWFRQQQQPEGQGKEKNQGQLGFRGPWHQQRQPEGEQVEEEQPQSEGHPFRDFLLDRYQVRQTPVKEQRR